MDVYSLVYLLTCTTGLQPANYKLYYFLWGKFIVI